MRQKTGMRLRRVAVLIVSALLIINSGSWVTESKVLADSTDLTAVATMELLDLYKKDAANQNVSLLGNNPANLNYGETLYGQLKWTFPDAPQDTVTPGQEYTYALPTGITFSSMSGNLLKGSDPVGTYNISGTSITIIYSDDNLGQEFCSGTNRWSDLTFSGKITKEDTEGQFLTSTTVNFSGIGERTIGLVPPAAPTSLDVNKDTREDISTPAEHRYRYTAYVISHGQNDNVVINDWTSQGLYMQENTISMYSDAACTIPYTGASQNWADSTGFKYTISSMSDGQTIYIRYEVVIDNALYDRNTAETNFQGYHGNVTNTIEAVSDTSSRVVDYNDIGTYSVYMNKYHGVDTVIDGTINWEIYLYEIPDSFNSGYIIDTIPANTEYVDGSLYVNYWGDDHTEAVTVERISDTQIKFNINDPDLLNYLKNVSGANCQITYKVRIIRQLTSYAVYDNSAVLYFDGNIVDTARADAGYTMPPILEKTGLYDDATAPNACFEVTVNPLSLDIDQSHDTLTLSDTFPDVYDLQVSSVVITRSDGQPLTSESYSYDETTRNLTINILDGKAYTVTYRATVNRRIGTPLDENNSTNTISVSGVTPVVSGATHFSCQVVRSSGSASSYNPNIASLNVIKHETGDTTAVISGAQFTLTEMNISSGNTVTAGDDIIKTTNTNGIASFEVEREKIYMLTETLAPSGYELDETIYFYAFADTNSSLPSTVTYSGQTYTVTVIDSDRVSRDVYFANDRASAGITDPATPTVPSETASPEATAAPASSEPVQSAPSTAAAAAAVTTPTEPSSEPSATTTTQDAVTAAEPAASGINPNDINGAGRDLGSEHQAETATNAAAVASVASTGEISSSARILGVIYIFVAFQMLALLRYERKHGMLPTGNNEQG